MKLLLDENLPHRLRALMVGHDVFTVEYMGWKGIGNGALLALAATHGFDAVVTKDTKIEYEQNLQTLPCALVVLEARSNSLEDIKPLLPALLSALDPLKPKSIVRVR